MAANLAQLDGPVVECPCQQPPVPIRILGNQRSGQGRGFTDRGEGLLVPTDVAKGIGQVAQVVGEIGQIRSRIGVGESSAPGNGLLHPPYLVLLFFDRLRDLGPLPSQIRTPA